MKLALIALLLPSALAAVKKTAANAWRRPSSRTTRRARGPRSRTRASCTASSRTSSGGSPELATPCSRARAPSSFRLVRVPRRRRRDPPLAQVPLRGPHGDELPVGQDPRLRLVVCARSADDLKRRGRSSGHKDGAMQKMKVGSKWGARLPARDRTAAAPWARTSRPTSVLVFTMEMLSCQGLGRVVARYCA